LHRCITPCRCRAAQFSHLESDYDGGSTPKRHLGGGGGPDIFLKLLIPRYTDELTS
jgi:hypothetical protein